MNKNKYEFTVKYGSPKINYTRVPNALIDDLMHYIKPNHLKVLLIFLRSKPDFKFNKTLLAKMLKTNRQNIQETLREMEEDSLIQFYKGDCHLNIHPANEELKEKRESKKIKKQKGLNNSNKANDVKSENDSKSAVKNTAPVNTLKPHKNKGFENDLAHPNNTNDNTILNSNKDYKEINKKNIIDNSNSLMGQGNSLEVILENPQFRNIYKYNQWHKHDISNFSDSYIAYLVIEKKLNNNSILDDKKLESVLYFLVQYALHDDTPYNNLKKEFINQLKKSGQEDQFNKFV